MCILHANESHFGYNVDENSNFLNQHFQSALLLTEVLRERDAQVTMKKKQMEASKDRDDHLIQLQRKVSRISWQLLCF